MSSSKVSNKLTHLKDNKVFFDMFDSEESFGF